MSKGDKESFNIAHSAAEPKLRKLGYSIGKEIGSGSYGKVFFAEYAEKDGSSRKLACKVVSTKTSQQFTDKFLDREIQILCAVNHKNLVKIHSLIQHKELYYFFMGFCENGDLLEFIIKNGSVVESQTRIWVFQMLEGLLYLHNKNIVHRDIKCENVFLTATLNIQIGDFGFARIMKNNSEMSKTYCGSEAYSSREILLAIPYEPKKADVWSLGVVLYVMLNKSMPFYDENNNKKKQADRQLNKQWKFRSKVIDILSDEVKDFQTLLLDPKPDTRPTVMESMQHTWFSKLSKQYALDSDKDSNRVPQGGKESMEGLSIILKAPEAYNSQADIKNEDAPVADQATENNN